MNELQADFQFSWYLHTDFHIFTLQKLNAANGHWRWNNFIVRPLCFSLWSHHTTQYKEHLNKMCMKWKKCKRYCRYIANNKLKIKHNKERRAVRYIIKTHSFVHSLPEKEIKVLFFKRKEIWTFTSDDWGIMWCLRLQKSYKMNLERLICQPRKKNIFKHLKHCGLPLIQSYNDDKENFYDSVNPNLSVWGFQRLLWVQYHCVVERAGVGACVTDKERDWWGTNANLAVKQTNLNPPFSSSSSPLHYT